jgi:hypothetical protein
MRKEELPPFVQHVNATGFGFHPGSGFFCQSSQDESNFLHASSSFLNRINRMFKRVWQIQLGLSDRIAAPQGRFSATHYDPSANLGQVQ